MCNKHFIMMYIKQLSNTRIRTHTHTHSTLSLEHRTLLKDTRNKHTHPSFLSPAKLKPAGRVDNGLWDNSSDLYHEKDRG
jgi:hypothetical protein